MPRGRKAKPNIIKFKEGNKSKDTGLKERTDNEPESNKNVPEPPSWLKPDKIGAAYFRRMGKLIHKYGLLTEIDTEAFAIHCKAYSRWRDAEDQLDKLDKTVYKPNKGSGYEVQHPYVTVAKLYYKQYVETGREFGLTPSARGRMTLAGNESKVDEFEEFLSGKKKQQAR